MKNSMKKISFAIAAVSLFGSAGAMANNAVSYNYGSLQYIDQDVDDYDCNQDGLRIGGSVELNDDFFALGSYSDVNGGRCGSENLNVGLGYRTLFGADSSLYGALSLENTSVDHGESDSGLIAAVGLRGFVANNTELKVELAHHTAFDGNTAVNGGVAYWFLPNLSATADASLGTETSEIALGLRLGF